MPATSVYISHRSAERLAASATAERSDAPLPRVVTSMPSVAP